MKKVSFIKLFSFLGIITFSFALVFFAVSFFWETSEGELTDDAWVATATTYDNIDNFDDFKAYLSNEEDKVLVLTSSFEVTETLTIAGNTKITSLSEVTLTRGASFTDDMFVLASGASVIVETAGGGISFNGNSVSAEGSAFRVVSGSSLKLGEGVVVTAFSSTTSGTAITNAGTLSLSGAEIYGNSMTAETSKYGIIYSTGTINFASGSVYNNSTTTSGVIFSSTSSVFNMSGGEIYGNTASTNGTIYIKDATATFSGGKIYSNTISNNGGGVYIADLSTAMLSGTEIYSNSAENNGGGVYICDTASVYICGSEITENTAIYGAGVYMTGSANLTLSGGSISSNISSKSGAGLFITDKSTFKMTGGEISGNSNTSGNGGAFVNKATAKISGGTITGNTATAKGGAIYNYGGGELEVSGGTITKNTSGTNGGAIANTSNLIVSGGTITLNKANSDGGAIHNADGDEEIGSVTISGGTFSGNTADYGGAFCNENGTFVVTNGTIAGNSSSSHGGGIYNKNGEVTISGGVITGNYNTASGADGGGIASTSTLSAGGATLTITGGTITGNSAMRRGGDIYSYAGNSSYPSTLQILGGTLGQVNAQYAVVELGGSFTMTNLTFNASKKSTYGYINIVSGLVNDVLITPYSSMSAEEATDTRFINYLATDTSSNIYQTARHIILDSSTLYVTVQDGEILVSSGEYKIDINADLCVINASLAGAYGDTISFSAFEEYQISNVVATTASGENVEVNFNETYSFTMPAESVTISYTYGLEELELTIDTLIEGLVSCEETYIKNEEVTITILDSNVAKIVKLYLVNGDNQEELTITNSTATFVMFKGAKITADVVYYYDITFENNSIIKNVDLVSQKASKGLEGEIISFTLETDGSGENARYYVTSVYYTANERVEITCDEYGTYSFVMPAQDIEICFEFGDIFEEYTGDIAFVATCDELSSALSGDKSVIVLTSDITLDSTLMVGEGEYTLIATGNYSIIRGLSLTENMFEIGYLSTLNLSLDKSGLGTITIDGNSANVTACGSAFYVYNSGVLNIYNGATITNNSLTCTNFIYTERSKGNENAGGSAIYVYNGIVNMYGGEICNNYATSNGSAVYNFGRFNLYGGSIHDNECTTTGTIYNIRVFNIEGGTIENNTAKYGGAVYNASSYYSFIYLVSGEVKNNTATASGGAFYVGYKSVAWIKGGSLTSNTAKNNGGAINSEGTLFVLDGVISQNVAGSKGGAIYSYGRPTYIRGGEFLSNTAETGGAICFASETTSQVTAGTFTGNTATYGGAICLVTSAQVEITGGIFSGNSATTRGGAIYLKNDKSATTVTTLTMTGGEIYDNSCENGDAICVQYAIFKLGGDVSIDGLVLMVAKPTENYAYVEFISVPTNTVKLRPYTYSSALDESVPNFIRLADGVDADAVAEKITFSSSKYETKVENGEILVNKIA